MTIINYASDGLYPELIVLFRVVAHLGVVDRKEIINLCYPGTQDDAVGLTRLRGALARWTELGLFRSRQRAFDSMKGSGNRSGEKVLRNLPFVFPVHVERLCSKHLIASHCGEPHPVPLRILCALQLGSSPRISTTCRRHGRTSKGSKTRKPLQTRRSSKTTFDGTA